MVRRATINDVARLAGVSTKTVSRVLNGEPHVREAVREKVRAVADELDYHPNFSARGLISQRNFLIGLTYERPSPSYVVELQRGALERLRHDQYRLIVLPFDDAASRPDELIGFLRSSGLDGVLLAPPACDLAPLLDSLDRAQMPYGRISPTHATERGASAVMDDVAAARAVASHLLGLGHRRFGIILGRETHAASEARLAGYREALAKAGIDLADVAIERGDFTFPSGQQAARRLLARRVRPTAVLAQNDDMAVAAIMTARDAGLDVPHDLSVAGFDDAEISRLSWPRLTTIRQPVFEMARDATDGLLALLHGEAAPQRHRHAHELLVRQSTGEPPD